MDREALLARWVEQPPASPIVQYLRDAEREAALDLLGTCESALDVAAEGGVTRNVDADRVTRVDFSPAASERAQETTVPRGCRSRAVVGGDEHGRAVSGSAKRLVPCLVQL